MRVPLVDIQAQLEPLATAVKREINDVIDSGRFVMGPKVEELESQIARYTETEHAIGVSSGTDALLVALMTLQVGPGDLVITTPYSFFATAGVIARLQATPVFVDIDPQTYNLDPQALAAWFADNPDLVSKVKAIMPVHLYGQCAEMTPILGLAREHEIPVVEDAAQALGSTYPLGGKARRAGGLATIGCFSFFPTKNLGALGDAGMVTTNDSALAESLRRMRVHGAARKYHHDAIGGNFRLDAIQAAALLVKLPHLDRWHKQRQDNASYYDEHLSGVTTPHIAFDRQSHIYNQYVISVPEKRDALRSFLADRDVASAIYYPLAFHQQPCFEYLGYREGQFPVSEHAASHTLALPVYAELSQAQQDTVIHGIRDFFG